MKYYVHRACYDCGLERSFLRCKRLELVQQAALSVMDYVRKVVFPLINGKN